MSTTVPFQPEAQISQELGVSYYKVLETPSAATYCLSEIYALTKRHSGLTPLSFEFINQSLQGRQMGQKHKGKGMVGRGMGNRRKTAPFNSQFRLN